MNEQITDRRTQKRLYTKFHTMNIMRSGGKIDKILSSNIRLEHKARTLRPRIKYTRITTDVSTVSI